MAVIILQHIVMLQLADTRKNVPTDERNTYRLPTGYMFAHVSCPHFALEISLYAIIHLILGLRRLPFTATFIFILSNQLCSGVLNHMWYQKNYPEFAGGVGAMGMCLLTLFQTTHCPASARPTRNDLKD
ncbi:hypothetical protein ACTXT7_008227 [Hymenolepis weldensis]